MMSKWMAGIVLVMLLATAWKTGATAAVDRMKPAAPLAGSAGRPLLRAGEHQGHPPEARALTFMVLGSVDLLVTDPQGRRVGVDPASGQVVQEIPGAYYYGPHESYGGIEMEIVSVYEPLDGDYTLLVIGTAESWFDLTVTSSAAQAGEVLFHDVGGILPGQTIEYTVSGQPQPPTKREIIYILPVMKGIGEWSSTLHLQNPAESSNRIRMNIVDGWGNLKIDASGVEEIAPRAVLPISLAEEP